MVHHTAKTYGCVEMYLNALLSSMGGLPHIMLAVPLGHGSPSTHCIGSGLDVVVVRKISHPAKKWTLILPACSLAII